MTITYLGELAVGATIPGATAGIAAGIAGMQTGLDTLNAQIAAMQGFVPAPISFDAQLALAQQMVTSLGLAISAGLSPPSLAAQIAAINAAIAAVLDQIGAVQVGLNIMLALETPLAAAGVRAYAYDGAVDAFGSELDAALGGSSDHANGVVLLTTIPATWDAMSIVFKVTP